MTSISPIAHCSAGPSILRHVLQHYAVLGGLPGFFAGTANDAVLQAAHRADRDDDHQDCGKADAELAGKLHVLERVHLSDLRIGGLQRLRLTALEFGEVHLDGRGADRLAGLRIDQGEIQLRAPGLAVVVEFRIVDEDGVGADLEGLLILGLVACQ